MNRRHFLAATAAGLCLGAGEKPRLKHAIKLDMVAGDAPLRDKFALVKKVGFEGVEVNSPSKLDPAELVAARDATGVLIHGVIDSVHWKDCLSDPDDAVRQRGLDALLGALRDAKRYGADTVLLVPGKVTKSVRFDECWSRSAAEVRKAIPLAAELGVKIAIEVVWNDFITLPKQLCDYIDQFGSPHVGAYFDCSNMLKYGVRASTWIRTLGKRMLKFDFKGYHVESKKWVGIGEGSEDWPDILKALTEVGYHGWATAEVKAGDEAWLRDVKARMDKILGA